MNVQYRASQVFEIARFLELGRAFDKICFFAPGGPNPLESLERRRSDVRKSYFRRNFSGRMAKRKQRSTPGRLPRARRLPQPSFRPEPTPSRHFDRSPGPWAGAERRNPEGAPSTPQAPASARRPSPAGFLHSLRSVEMTVGCCASLESTAPDRLPPTRHFDRSPGPPGRGGVEKPGGRSIDASGSGPWPASVAGRISPLAPLGRNDGWVLRFARIDSTRTAVPPPVISTGAPALGPGRSGETRRALHRRRRLRRPPGPRRRPDFSTRSARSK